MIRDGRWEWVCSAVWAALLGSMLAVGCAVPTDDGSPGAFAPSADAFPGQRGVAMTALLRVNGELVPVTYERIGAVNVFERDVVLADELLVDAEPVAEGEVGSRSSALAPAPDDWRWPEGVVPYAIDPDLPDPARVHAAIAQWEERTMLRFVPHNTQDTWAYFAPGEGCSAEMGTTTGARRVTLAPACDAVVVVHEIGHVVGLFHEHNRPDRDGHVQIHWDNVDPAFRHAFEISDAARADGGYDLGSVMHYGPHAFSVNGNPTITRLDGSPYPDNREGLSGQDAARVDAWYDPIVTSGCDALSRLAGSDRFQTAVAVSQALFDSADVAVVVSGEERAAPDALAAGPLAASLGGPVLLTGSDRLASATAGELTRLGVRTVYVVGGPSAVPDAVLDELRAAGHAVDRISGATRFGTAAAVGRRMGSSSGLAFIASGADGNMVDALAASGAGAAVGAPILLVTADTIPDETRAALRDLGITRTYVVGGPAAVSSTVEASLPDPARIAGPDRYSTATTLATYIMRHEGVDASQVLIARGDVLVDGLAAGAAGRLTLLSPPDRLPSTTARFLSDHVVSVTLVGGESALSEDVEREACVAL